MPEELPIVFPQPTRDELRDNWLRDMSFYSEGTVAVHEGTHPWLEANVLADQLLPGYLRANQVADNLVLTQATGRAAEQWAESKGLPGRLAATGASGFVIVSTSVGGATLFAGDELKSSVTGQRYQVVATNTYVHNALVPITAIDTGAATNLNAGSVLTWTAPRPGCGPSATVWQDTDGNGLTGGRAEESDAEIVQRVIDVGRNPPASGNDAQVRAWAKQTPGLAVQEAFTYPAILGPGTIGLVVSLSSNEPGGDRTPNPQQLLQLQHWMGGLPNHDHQILICELLGSPVDVRMRVRWKPGVASWTDAVPWPPYYGGTADFRVQVGSTPTATSFVIERENNSYVSVQAPTVGKTLAFYNQTTKKFVPKRIAALTGTGPWTVTVDTSNNSSDTTFVPTAGARIMPYSTSLDLLTKPLLSYVDTLGPGEQLNTFFDAGLRQRRSPPPGQAWPSSFTNRWLFAVQDLEAVDEVIEIYPGVTFTAQLGTAGVRSYVFQLNNLTVWAL